MANSSSISKLPVEQETDETDIRAFLASIELLDGVYSVKSVHRGRALIQYYAECLAEFGDSSNTKAPLSVDECADVLDYLSSVTSANHKDCFGHSQGAAACGFMQIMAWMRGELRRHAKAEDAA